MSHNSLIYGLELLLGQSPVLLVCVIGICIALVHLHCHTTPAVLSLVGCGVLILTTLAVTGVQMYLFQQRAGNGEAGIAYAQAMSVLMILGSLVRAIGLGLLVVAVFTGRNQAPSGHAVPSRGP